MAALSKALVQEKRCIDVSLVESVGAALELTHLGPVSSLVIVYQPL